MFITLINITLGPVVLCAAFRQFSTVYPEYSVLLFLHKPPKIRKKHEKIKEKKNQVWSSVTLINARALIFFFLIIWTLHKYQFMNVMKSTAKRKLCF